MSERLDAFPPTTPQYPWEQWFDGAVWKLDPKVDLDEPLEAFRAKAWSKANRLGFRLTTKTIDGFLYIQASED